MFKLLYQEKIIVMNLVYINTDTFIRKVVKENNVIFLKGYGLFKIIEEKQETRIVIYVGLFNFLKRTQFNLFSRSAVPSVFNL